MKKSKKTLITLIIIIIILILALLAYKYFYQPEKVKEVKVIKKISSYDYELKENETKLYKDEFNKLDEILKKENVDYEEYAKQVSKLFIIDFYTLDNKLSKNDIGGLEFIKDDMKDNFIEQARSTFYKYVEVKSDKRTQKLPEVSEISDVTIENTSFVIKNTRISTTKSSVKTKTTTSVGTTVDAYKVSITWDYKEDLDYEKEANLIIIKDGKKLYIVEMD